MKAKELIVRLPERTRRSVEECYRRKDLNRDIEIFEKDELRKAVRVFKLLANPVRLQILKFLSQGEHCVCLTSAALEIEQTIISHHISKLLKAGFLKQRIHGRMRFYSLKNKKLKEILEDVLEL
ncbi:MAG: ArsR/SmtB family transcription factor [Candidatus Methanofastidiosia archaeon]